MFVLMLLHECCIVGMRACSSIGDCHISADCVTGLCQCNHGYQGDGKYSCVDIDECTHNTTCHVNANCHNTNGSYTCTCKAGYYRSGYECLGKCEVTYIHVCSMKS